VQNFSCGKERFLIAPWQNNFNETSNSCEIKEFILFFFYRKEMEKIKPLIF